MFKNLSFLALAFVISSCASTANLSSTGKATLKADEYVKAAGLFQDTAIALNNQKVINEADTKLVVLFVKGSVQTAKSAPDGWKATVNTGLDNLEASLSPVAKQKLGSYIVTARTVISLIQ